MKVLKLFLDKLNMKLEKNYDEIIDPKYYIWDNKVHKIIGEGNTKKDIIKTVVDYIIRKYNYDKIALKNMYILENIEYCKSIIEKQENNIKKLRKQYSLGNAELEVLKDFCHKFGYTFIIKDKNKYEIENEKLNKCLALQNIYLKNLGYEISGIIELYLMNDNIDRKTIYSDFLKLAKIKGVVE